LSINFKTGCTGVVNGMENHDIIFVEDLMKLPSLHCRWEILWRWHVPETVPSQMEAGPESTEPAEAPEAEAGPQAAAPAGPERRRHDQPLVIPRTGATGSACGLRRITGLAYSTRSLIQDTAGLM
jgi:hypothetical protein